MCVCVFKLTAVHLYYSCMRHVTPVWYCCLCALRVVSHLYVAYLSLLLSLSALVCLILSCCLQMNYWGADEAGFANDVNKPLTKFVETMAKNGEYTCVLSPYAVCVNLVC